MLNFNKKALQKYNMSEAELLYLVLNTSEVFLDSIRESVLKKGFAEADLYNNNQVVLNENNKEFLKKVLVEADTEVTASDNKKDKLSNIAQALKQCYTEHGLKGIRPGGNYRWLCSDAELETKLQVLIVKYKASFTLEEAVEVTNKYLDRFLASGTPLKYLPTVKYYVLKGKGEDMQSCFLSELENKDIEPEDNWTEEFI